MHANGAKSFGAHRNFGSFDVIAIGSIPPTTNFDGATEKFDVGQSSWLIKAKMPMGRCQLALGTVRNSSCVFAVGGSGNGWTNLATVGKFCSSCGCWDSAAPMPSARNFAGAATIGSEPYVAGGRGLVGLSTLLEIYHAATDSWSSAPPMPTARNALGVAAIGSKLYTIGGWSST